MKFSQLAALISFFFVLLAPLPSAAQDGNNLVKIRLLPERGTVKAGQSLWIGVEQSIAPGWHTYWRNPGDSGAQPRIDWTLPEGFTISDIHWPAPMKLPFGPLLNYGYEDHVILLQKLKAPAELPAGPLTLQANIEVLVCKEECIPEFGSYELVLNGPGASTEDNRSYLNEAREQVPRKTDWSVSFYEENERLTLEFRSSEQDFWDDIDIDSIEMFPQDWGIIDNPAALEAALVDGHLVLHQDRGIRPLKAVDTYNGVLTFARQEQTYARSFSASPVAPPLITIAPVANTSQTSPSENGGLAQALVLALLGGLILNLMPCVFPVLSIKALSLVKVAEKKPGLARAHGLAYTAGVVLSFLLIAGILISLKAAGTQIGWGFQLQNPIVVTLLAYLLFIIGLNLSGVFAIAGHFGNIGSRLAQGQDLSSSFFTGTLATLVATPCTAPFMAAAIGYALTHSALISFLVFAALGLGLALPYLALSFIPAVQKALPKPGAWMEVFRQFLAFPMFASAAWLIWVVSQQAGSTGLLSVLFGMIAIAFGFWLWQHQPQSVAGKVKIRILIAIAFLIALALIPGHSQTAPESMTATQESFGETWNPQKLEDALKSADPVFVEMTAAWCITCKVNHALAIDIPSTRKLIEQQNIRYLIGDWTNQDPQITAYLDSFGRSGVPIYVYYGPPDSAGNRPQPDVLPQILTPGIVAGALKGR